MRFRNCGVVVVAGYLGGCSVAANPPPLVVSQTPVAPPAKQELKIVKLAAADIEAIKAGVRKALKDPESARFGDMKAGADEKNVVTVCGYVNAKNSFGGYTGEKLFTGVIVGNDSKKAFAVVGMGGTETQSQIARTVCGDMGLLP